MKDLREMTSKELKEMAKEMKISNWWNLKKDVLITKIEEIQNMSDEEKQAIADQKAKEDAAIKEYTKNWQKYTKRYNVLEFIEKWRSGKIVLESEAAEETPETKTQPAGTLIETPAPEELPEVTVVKDKPVKQKENKIAPFVYTDANGDEWEDYDIGEKIAKWSDDKKAAFRQYYEDTYINNEIEVDEDEMLKEWSAVYDEKNGIKPEEKKEGHKPSPKRGALIEFDGKSQNICAWGEELGISANTLYGRIYKLGWSVERAFTTPGKKSK